MATGRIRRRARRGLAVAVLGWLCAGVTAVVVAPSAGAAPSATIEIRNVTPPAAGVDAGGTVTFVNKIPPQNEGGISVPPVGSLSATVYTDVAVTFFGQRRPLQLDQSGAWTFKDPATTGTIEYTYRIVPQAGLPSAVATQVVNTVAASLPALPLPTPYVVQTIAPGVPDLPSVNLPQPPQVTLPLPDVKLPGVTTPGSLPMPNAPAVPTGGTPAVPDGVAGTPYEYTVDAPQQVVPVSGGAAAAFDPSRYYVPGQSIGSPDRSGSGSGGSARGSGGPGGAGGQPGTYDGASVPIFGRLTGLDNASLDQQAADRGAGAGPAQTLPVAALVALVALTTVTAALVRIHQGARSR